MLNDKGRVISTGVICKQVGRYIGWPTITKRKTGELLVVFSGDRDAHVCPWGKTQMVKSVDDGKTWSEPITINDTPLDDRGAGIVETRNGTLIVSGFTSVYFAEHEAECRKWYGDDMVNGWKERIATAGDAKIRQQYLGNWVRRSEDGGQTWKEPVKTIGSAPHGPVEMESGRLLYVEEGRINDKPVLTVEQSNDDGCSWGLVSTVPIPSDESLDHYYEPHLCQLKDGNLIAAFRYHLLWEEGFREEPGFDIFLRQSESSDGGRTWSVAHKTSICGYPPHLICLKNGWIVVVYGRRFSSCGERACISRDGGRSWDVDNEIELTPGPNGDLGYPSSAELDDGSILTVYYQIDKPGEKPCLMGTHWLPPAR